MAKETVELLVDDLDGSEAVETVRLGWNGDWRELELSKKNLAALSKALDKYWNVSRPVGRDGQAKSHRRSAPSRRARTVKVQHDPKLIRVWAARNGIEIRSRGRIPAHVLRQYDDAHRRS